MNSPAFGHPRLERLLAAVLQYGTWLASAVTASGLALALIDTHTGTQNLALPANMRIVSLGIVLFILLPVLRVLLMLLVFLQERNYRFTAIATLVLAIIALSFFLGWRASGGTAISGCPPLPAPAPRVAASLSRHPSSPPHL